MLTFRKALPDEAGQITAIYDRILAQEEAGLITVGWQRGVYPTLQTAQASIEQGEMYVALEDGMVVASGRINQEQVPEYALASWHYPAADEQVMVLHTLTVDPLQARRGIAKAFIRFYEKTALAAGCPCLRIDTNERNSRARAMYRHLGFEEVGIVPCTFNGIAGVQLVCLEKYLGGANA